MNNSDMTEILTLIKKDYRVFMDTNILMETGGDKLLLENLYDSLTQDKPAYVSTSTISEIDNMLNDLTPDKKSKGEQAKRIFDKLQSEKKLKELKDTIGPFADQILLISAIRYLTRNNIIFLTNDIRLLNDLISIKNFESIRDEKKKDLRLYQLTKEGGVQEFITKKQMPSYSSFNSKTNRFTGDKYSRLLELYYLKDNSNVFIWYWGDVKNPSTGEYPKDAVLLKSHVKSSNIKFELKDNAKNIYFKLIDKERTELGEYHINYSKEDFAVVLDDNNKLEKLGRLLRFYIETKKIDKVDNLGIWLWGDVLNPSESAGKDFPYGTQKIKTDGKRYFFDIRLKKFPKGQLISFIIVNRRSANLKYYEVTNFCVKRSIYFIDLDSTRCI